METITAALEVDKSFDADVDTLYGAWTSPESLKQWWRPMGYALTDVENQVEPGGRVVYKAEEDLQIHGEYREVSPGEYLFYTWIWETPKQPVDGNAYQLQVWFQPYGQGSRIVVRQTPLANASSADPRLSEGPYGSVPESTSDLQGPDLQGADLQGADFQGADLQGPDLQGADLQGHVDVHLQGWEKALEELKKYVEAKAS